MYVLLKCFSKLVPLSLVISFWYCFVIFIRNSTKVGIYGWLRKCHILVSTSLFDSTYSPIAFIPWYIQTMIYKNALIWLLSQISFKFFILGTFLSESLKKMFFVYISSWHWLRVCVNCTESSLLPQSILFLIQWTHNYSCCTVNFIE